LRGGKADSRRLEGCDRFFVDLAFWGRRARGSPSEARGTPGGPRVERNVTSDSGWRFLATRASQVTLAKAPAEGAGIFGIMLSVSTGSGAPAIFPFAGGGRGEGTGARVGFSATREAGKAVRPGGVPESEGRSSGRPAMGTGGCCTWTLLTLITIPWIPRWTGRIPMFPEGFALRNPSYPGDRSAGREACARKRPERARSARPGRPADSALRDPGAGRILTGIAGGARGAGCNSAEPGANARFGARAAAGAQVGVTPVLILGRPARLPAWGCRGRPGFCRIGPGAATFGRFFRIGLPAGA